MRKRKIKAGPLVALGLFVAAAGYVVTVVAWQSEPEAQIQTSLPLARI